MAKRGRRPSLDKLEAQRKELAAKIRAAKKEEKAAAAEVEQKRFAIIGMAIAKELAANESLARELEPLINKRVTKAAERRFLGLEPLPNKGGQAAS